MSEMIEIDDDRQERQEVTKENNRNKGGNDEENARVEKMRSQTDMSRRVIGQVDLAEESEQVDDCELVLSFRQGMEAYNRLYMQHRVSLFSYAVWKSGGNHQLAEDVFQLTWEKVTKLMKANKTNNILDYAQKNTLDFPAFFRGLLKNSLASHFRSKSSKEVSYGGLAPDSLIAKRGSYTAEGDAESDDDYVLNGCGEAEDPAGKIVNVVNRLRLWLEGEIESNDPLHKLEKNDGLNNLKICINKLPEAQRYPLKMNLAGLSYEEIGEILDLTPEGVRTRIKKARKKLVACLAPIFGEDIGEYVK